MKKIIFFTMAVMLSISTFLFAGNNVTTQKQLQYKANRDVTGAVAELDWSGVNYYNLNSGASATMVVISTYPVIVYGVLMGTGTAGTDTFTVYDGTTTTAGLTGTVNALLPIVCSSATQNTFQSFPTGIAFQKGLSVAASGNAVTGTVLWRFRTLSSTVPGFNE